MSETRLHIATPTILCKNVDAGCEVFLKLENLQPPGTFKIRGIGNLCVKVTS